MLKNVVSDLPQHSTKTGASLIVYGLYPYSDVTARSPNLLLFLRSIHTLRYLLCEAVQWLDFCHNHSNSSQVTVGEKGASCLAWSKTFGIKGC